MASQIVMPKMSETMEEGVVVKWLKREGDRVASGDALAEIETDKAVLELEATTAGVLRKILAQEDSKVPVGQLLAVIGSADEDVSSLIGRSSSPFLQPSPHDHSCLHDIRCLLRALPFPAQGKLPDRNLITRERIDASPLARRMAEEAGIDIAQVPGTGPGGRVVKRDIEAFLAQLRSQPARPPAPPVTAPAAALEASLQVPAQLAPVGVARRRPYRARTQHDAQDDRPTHGAE